MAKLKCIKIDANDWNITSGRSIILTDADALAQRIACRVSLWKAEWYQDTTLGIDYLTLFNIGVAIEDRLSAAIKKVMLEDEYVQSVNTISVTTDSEGNVKIEYEIISTFGLITGAV